MPKGVYDRTLAAPRRRSRSGSYVPRARKKAPVERTTKKKQVMPVVQVTGTDEFIIDKPVGEIIRLSRTGLGWSAEELAGRAGVHPSTVARAERDDNLKGSWGWMRCRVQILNALGYTVSGRKET